MDAEGTGFLGFNPGRLVAQLSGARRPQTHRLIQANLRSSGVESCPANQERVLRNLLKVVEELGVEATFAKVKDLDAIMAYDVMSTPALAIDEEVKSSGHIPRKEEVAKWVQAAQ